MTGGKIYKTGSRKANTKTKHPAQYAEKNFELSIVEKVMWKHISRLNFTITG